MFIPAYHCNISTISFGTPNDQHIVHKRLSSQCLTAFELFYMERVSCAAIGFRFHKADTFQRSAFFHFNRIEIKLLMAVTVFFYKFSTE